MSDQIIIEFIGDPSGLKPAEEALRGLGKSSQDTVAAFDKANDAAKKFAEGAKEAATAVKSAGDAAEKSVKSLSTLSQAISSGAVKAIAEDFTKWAKEVADLGTKKGELKQKLADVNAEMVKAQGVVNASKEVYSALGKQAKAVENDINSTEKAITRYSEAAAKTSAKNIELGDKLDKVRASIAAMNGTSEEGSEKYNKLVATAAKLEGQIAKNDKSILDSMAKTRELANTNASLTAKYDEVQSQMGKVKAVMDENKASYDSLSKKAKEYKGDITGIDKKLAEVNKTFSGHSKAAKESTHSITSMIGNTKKLVSAVGEMDAAFMSATGNEREANKIRERTTEVLQAFATVEAVVTTATEAWTVATEVATVATTALDVALAPVAVTVGAVAAVVALVAAQAVIFYEVGKKVVAVVEEKFQVFEKIKPMLEMVGKAMNWLTDQARQLASEWTNGFIESPAMHRYNNMLESHAKTCEKISAEYKKQADMMEAEGKSVADVAQTRANALKAEQDALVDRLRLANNETKQAELREKITKNTIETIGQQKNVIEGVGTELAKQGKTEGQILQAKEEQIKLTMERLKDERLIHAVTQEQKDSLDAQLAAMKNLLAETEDVHKTYNKEKAKKDYADALESAKRTADLRLAIAKEGSEAELAARLQDMKAAMDIELNNEKLTRTQAELIRLRLAQDTAKEIQSFYQKALAEEEKDEKKSDEEKYNAKMAILARERTAIAQNDKLSAAQKVELFKQVNEQEDAIWQAYTDAQTARQKAAAAAILAAAQAAEDEKLRNAMAAHAKEYQDGIATEEKLIADKKEKYDSDITNASLSIKTKLALNEQYHSSVASALQNEMALLEKRYNDDIIAAKGNSEKLKKINEDHANDTKLIQEKITANTNEQRKKREELVAQQSRQEEDIAKQVGQKLIEMAKQVSDAIFENEKQKRDNNLKEKIDNLEAHKEAELMNMTLTAAQRKAIEKKYKIEEAQEKEKAWKADQKAKAEQAIINGLLAFTSALFSSPPPMNYVNAAIALASAGVQAGIIMSKTPPKFAKGVVALDGPGTETSDSIPAYLSKGESVITASATRRYQPLLEAMNAGTLDRYMPLPQMPDVRALEHATQSSHRMQPEKIDYEKIGEVLARRINMKQLNVSIDEKGFTKSVVSRGQRITSYNDRMKF